MKKEITSKTPSKIPPMERINTRIRQNQHKYVKILAKKTNRTEGEIFRDALDFYMERNK